MAQSMSDIKRRSRSVENTKQITKAMEMVSAAKLRKAREKAELGRPYFEKLIETVQEIVKIAGSASNPYMEVRQVSRAAFIVITGDRGLSGGYNSNVIQKAMSNIENSESTSIIALGTKGRDYFKRRGYEIDKEYIGISEEPDISNAREIGDRVMELFINGEVDEVYIAYTKFVSTISQEPKIQKLLPIAYEENVQGEENQDKGRRSLVEYEPSEEGVLAQLVPSYIYNTIYGAMTESAASQQAATKVAMEAATENADEIIAELELSYNRARQGAITQEISEIVGGSEALN